MSAPASPRRPVPAVVWVLLAVAAGCVAGAVLAIATPAPVHAPGPHQGPAPAVGNQLPLFVSGLDLVLLVALLAVYVRTFAETRARFALGLIIFLVVLLFEAIVSSPALFGALGYGPGNLGFFFLLSGVLEAIALTIFLYLSLE